VTCSAACQSAETPGCRCRECRGEQHGTLAAQQRLDLRPETATEAPRAAVDIEVNGRLVHLIPVTQIRLDCGAERSERGWRAALGGGRRGRWAKTPEEAAREHL
jgi:hypothetical protein